MSEAVSIRILDREYTVGVDPEQRESLLAAARLLETKMRAALNLAHELELTRESQRARDRELAQTLVDLNRRLDALPSAD